MKSRSSAPSVLKHLLTSPISGLTSRRIRTQNHIAAWGVASHLLSSPTSINMKSPPVWRTKRLSELQLNESGVRPRRQLSPAAERQSGCRRGKRNCYHTWIWRMVLRLLIYPLTFTINSREQVSSEHPPLTMNSIKKSLWTFLLNGLNVRIRKSESNHFVIGIW